MNVEMSQAVEMIMQGSSFFACAALVWIMLRKLPLLVNASVARHTGYPSDQQMLASIRKTTTHNKELLTNLVDTLVNDDTPDTKETLVGLSSSLYNMQEDFNNFAAAKAEHDKELQKLVIALTKLVIEANGEILDGLKIPQISAADFRKFREQIQSRAANEHSVTCTRLDKLKDSLGKISQSGDDLKEYLAANTDQLVKGDVTVQLVREMLKLARISELMPAEQFDGSAKRIVEGVLADLNIKVDGDKIDVSNASVMPDFGAIRNEPEDGMREPTREEWAGKVEEHHAGLHPVNEEGLISWVTDAIKKADPKELDKIVQFLHAETYKPSDALTELAQAVAIRALQWIGERRDLLDKLAALLPAQMAVYLVDRSYYVVPYRLLATQMHYERTNAHHPASKITDILTLSCIREGVCYQVSNTGKARYLGDQYEINHDRTQA